MREVIDHLRQAALPKDTADLTDAQLLEHYLTRRDEAAIAGLVQRHGPMVWGVCRRILDNLHDAEDAFQATFLVFARKAASLDRPALLANWLYGVAHHTARKARALIARRRGKERPVSAMPDAQAAEQGPGHEMLPVLDDELSRLPDKYRVVIVLCDLEGKTRKEAARLLGCPEGTVAGRLSRARALLANRLRRRGAALPGVFLAAVPASLVVSTARAARVFASGQTTAGMISSPAVALAEGVLQAMLSTKLGVGKVVLCVLALAGACATLSIQARGHPQGKESPPPAKKAATADEDVKALVGEWKLVSVTIDGKETKSVEGEEGRWWFKEKEYGGVGEGSFKHSFKLSPDKKPKAIDVTVPGPGDKKVTVEGIYLLEKDKLTICLRQATSARKGRPAEFKSEAGSGVWMWKLERIKKP
jgi:RNA polymerase sigma factor (sigma-70 family)